MQQGIFSTYRQGENRVTGSIIAVLASLSIARTERLLRALLDDDEFQLVRFRLQPTSSADSVPDAEIRAAVRLLLETKIKRGAVDAKQLRRHVAQLGDVSDGGYRSLLVLTPDGSQPAAIDSIGDGRIRWASFGDLSDAIDALLADEREVVSERESYLLHELQILLDNEGLVTPEEDTVVVPARHAWPMYHSLNAYICQAGRVFRPVTHLGFYAEGAIQDRVPRIIERWNDVELRVGAHAGRLGEIVDRYLNEFEPHSASEFRRIFDLTGPDDPATIRLKGPVPNDLTSGSGRVVAFTQSQRYVRSEALKTARSTSELVDAEAVKRARRAA